jgi:hypothetical protein
MAKEKVEALVLGMEKLLAEVKKDRTHAVEVEFVLVLREAKCLYSDVSLSVVLLLSKGEFIR